MDFFDLELLQFVSIGQALLWTTLAILIDAAAGILLAVKKGTFELGETFRFLKSSVLPYIGALALAAALAYGAPVTEAIFLVAAAGVTIVYIKEFYSKLVEIGRKKDDDQQGLG